MEGLVYSFFQKCSGHLRSSGLGLRAQPRSAPGLDGLTVEMPILFLPCFPNSLTLHSGPPKADADLVPGLYLPARSCTCIMLHTKLITSPPPGIYLGHSNHPESLGGFPFPAQEMQSKREVELKIEAKVIESEVLVLSSTL